MRAAGEEDGADGNTRGAEVREGAEAAERREELVRERGGVVAERARGAQAEALEARELRGELEERGVVRGDGVRVALDAQLAEVLEVREGEGGEEVGEVDGWGVAGASGVPDWVDKLWGGEDDVEGVDARGWRDVAEVVSNNAEGASGGHSGTVEGKDEG